MKAQPAPVRALSDHLAFIQPTMSRRQARSALYKAGWEFVGGGSFASVWASPDGSRVAKVTKPDYGQRALVAAALKHPDNPHLPTIYGFLQLHRGGFIVEMERLDWDGEYDEVYDEVEDFMDGHAPVEGRVSPYFYTAWHAIEAERLASTRRLAWDLHDENLMFRDGTPVLLDPLFEPRAHIRSATYDGSRHSGLAGLTRSARLAA